MLTYISSLFKGKAQVLFQTEQTIVTRFDRKKLLEDTRFDQYQLSFYNSSIIDLVAQIYDVPKKLLVTRIPEPVSFP